jgi:hypothetical protein
MAKFKSHDNKYFIMHDFDINSIPDLDEVVVWALELFIQNGVSTLDFARYKKPLVVGSGNAAVTGRIIFEESDAIFADESNYKVKLDSISDIDGAILISASGSKHAIPIAQELRNRGIDFVLLTNNANAPAKEFVDEDKFIVFPRNKEPYTYNTSTYMSMILGKTKEDPQTILDFINEHVKPIIPKDIGKYDGYYLMIPSRLESTSELFITKFVELFGRAVARDVFTDEHSKHATTVVPSNELFIEFGDFDIHVGEPVFKVPLPDNCGPATLMAIAYFVIGYIQKQKPPMFKDNIDSYTKKASELFGFEIKPIVD